MWIIIDMYNYDKNNGDLVFINKKKEKFYWNYKNYTEHCQKHNITGEKNLDEIDKTLENPDCITEGPKPKQETFYCVVKHQKFKNSISVFVWRVVCFKRSKNYIIATAFSFWSSNYRVINDLEKIIWKKTNLLI
jgi:hypothetical protein